MARKRRKKRSIVAKIIGVVFIFIFIAIAAVGGLLAFLTVTEYEPGDTEKLKAEGEASKTLNIGDTITLLTFNTGYAALDKDHDFFMDGGKNVNCDSEEQVINNLNGIINILKEVDADVTFLQEVDVNSKRSANVNQSQYYYDISETDVQAFAYNFKCLYIPYPVLEPIGKVNSGILTLSKFAAKETERIALPTAFDWPVRTCQLKRGLLLMRIPIEDSTKELVIINLHLEAYDDGEGKIEQTKILANVLKSEYEKGNYCIAGGDFNQTFPSVNAYIYPLINEDYFTPGILDTSLWSESWSFAADDSCPTARLLNQPYNAANSNNQFYVIDGFILSPNIRLESVKTLDKGFEYSDHNPVTLEVTLY